MYSMPAFLQASISVALIGREASLMSVSPRQNFWNPPPVPEMPTVTRTPLLAFWKSSATASVIGNTVLEPSIWITDGAAAVFRAFGAGVTAPSTAGEEENEAQREDLPRRSPRAKADVAHRRVGHASTLSNMNFAPVSWVLNPCYRVRSAFAFGETSLMRRLRGGGALTAAGGAIVADSRRTGLPSSFSNG